MNKLRMGPMFSRNASFLKNYSIGNSFREWWNYILDGLLERPILTQELLEILYEDDGTNYETEKAWGVITTIRENQSIAIINHDIYMDLSISLPGGKTLRLGDHVLCIIKRRNEDDAWRVERIEMIERKTKTWGDSEENSWDQGSSELFDGLIQNVEGLNVSCLKSKTILGKVTTVGENVVLDDGKLEIPAKSCQGASYILGDWLAVRVLIDPEEPEIKPKILRVEPLRTWQHEGRINIIKDKTGVIDDDIYFHIEVCINGYIPKLKDWVHYVAIESQHGGAEFTWRAISIVPSSYTLSKRTSLLPTNHTTRANMRDTIQVAVDREANFGEVEFNEEKELKVLVRNLDHVDHLLKNINFLNSRTNYEIRNATLPIILPAGGQFYIEVFFKANSMGKVEDIMELDFGSFIIERSVSAEVRPKANSSLSNSADRFLERFSKYKPISLRQVMEDEYNREGTWTTKGVRPYKPPPFTTTRLEQFPIPKALWQTVQQDQDVVANNPVLAQTLGPDTYSLKFQILLHLEEIENTVILRSYDIPRAALKPVGPYLSLEVNGLAEKRPSLVPGDEVILSNPWGGGGLNHQGFVHATLRSAVLLQFDSDFHAKYDGKDYAVRFAFSRIPLRRQHTAIKLAAKQPGYKVLFPFDLELRPPQVNVRKNPGRKLTVADRLSNSQLIESDIDWINSALNEEQKRAILHIIEGVYRPIPYIIFGPPGTGKTVTVVEAILQIFSRCPKSRILVATPSNSSADLIASRLIQSNKINPGDMVRLNAYCRSIDSIPELILSYSLSCEEILSAVRHRILVTTCTTAGKVYTMSLEIGHFTHLFIDEAGQATEPESLVPIGLIRCDSNPGQIVLAGDPKQLGPVLMSSYSSAYGLGLSLLERLTESQFYSRNAKFARSGYYDPKLITKLVRNYRSHSALLSLPSFMFYDDELIPCASSEVAQRLAHFTWLPKAGLPLVFHGIRGENYQESDSPSWFNPAEVYHVIRYLQLLLNAKLDPEEIGVITPYRKQVEKIREFIKTNDLFPVKVGSVEEFQGQERDVIIVSTVRSHESNVSGDLSNHLGFLRNPKRFNVTITRAKSLLIVIGNPHLLNHDKHWGPFLRHCVQLGGYAGCDLPQFE